MKKLLGLLGGTAAPVVYEAGEPGYYDPLVYYDAGLEPVVADSTAMVQLTDFSGNGHHQTQSTGTSRAAYRTNDTNGQPAFEFDGSADCYATAAAVDLSHTNAVTIVAVVKPTTSAAFRVLAELSANYGSGAGRFMIQHENNNVPSTNHFGTGNVSFVHDLAWNGATHTYFARIDMSKSRDEGLSYLDGMLATTAPSSTNNAGNFAADQVLHFGSRAGSSRFWLGRVHLFALYDRALTEDELGELSVGLGTRFAITHGIYTAADPAVNLADNTVTTGHYSPLHRLVFDTTSQRIAVAAVSDQNVASPSQLNNAEIGLREANADVTTWANNLGSSVVTRHAIKTLTAGSKRIELVSNAPGRSPAVTGTVYGQHLLGVWIPSDATTTHVVPDDADRIVVYGDSIAIGDKATNAVLGGWASIVRASFYADAAFEGNLRVHAYGNRTLYEDGNTAGLRTTLAAELTVDSPSIIWLCIGYNDYGHARPSILPSAWNAAAFQTAYADLLDKLIAAAPSADIYAQSPIGKTTPAGTVNGEVIAAYRTAISNACTGKANVTYVDGLTILDYAVEPTDYSGDGIHPDDSGYVTMAGRIETVLGIA